MLSFQPMQIAQGSGRDIQVAAASGEPILSLRAWPGETSKSENIPFLISRINAQRGSFRNITETSLAQEAEAEAADAKFPVNGDDAQSPVPDSPDEKTLTEDIFKARGEILQAIGYGTHSP